MSCEATDGFPERREPRTEASLGSVIDAAVDDRRVEDKGLCNWYREIDDGFLGVSGLAMTKEAEAGVPTDD